MGPFVYSMCALTCLACAFLLLRSYRQSRTPLLLWSGLCFVGLTVSNVLLVLDRVVFPELDMSTPRLVAALFALLLLVFGLIWESE